MNADDEARRLADEALNDLRSKARAYDPATDGLPDDFEHVEVGDDRPYIHPELMRRYELVWACDVEEEIVTYIWEGRIPMGYLTLFVGKPKAGKSSIAVDAVARFSSMRPLPGNKKILEPHPVMWVTYEETSGKIKRSLIGAGANMKNVLLSAEKRLYNVGHLVEMMDQMADAGFRFFVIDNMLHLLNGEDGNGIKETVPLLGTLQAFAQQRKSAVVLLAHAKKGTGHSAMDRILGSTGISAVARAAIQVTKQPGGSGSTRELHTVFMNMDEAKAGQTFRIIKDENGRPSVEWLDEIENDPDGAVHREAEAANPEQGGRGGDTTNEGLLLAKLRESPGGMKPAEIGDFLRVSSNTVSRLLAKMEGWGVISTEGQGKAKLVHAIITTNRHHESGGDDDCENREPSHDNATEREPGDDDPDKVGW